MYPFIHIGPLTLGSYGLMVAIGLICAFFILRADFARRGVSADAEAIIGITGLAGLAGSRLYHLLESPAEFFADPWPQLFSTMGFAFAGAIIGGFIALVLLGKRFRMPMLLMLDAASPAAAMGYGIGRIGCLLSGDGDYGIATNLPWGMAFHPLQPGSRILGFIQVDRGALVPSYGRDVRGLPLDAIVRVHPTPIYEFLAAILIFWILWRLGARGIENARPERNYFRGVSCAHGDRAVSGRDHSHQSALVLRADERAGGQRGFGLAGALFVYCRTAARQEIRA